MRWGWSQNVPGWYFLTQAGKKETDILLDVIVSN